MKKIKFLFYIFFVMLGLISCGSNDKDNTTISESTHNHLFSSVEYIWSSDYKQVIAKRSCLLDTSHIEIEIVNTTSEVIKNYSCTEDEITKYTAIFINEAFETQTKEVVTASACDHNYGEVKYEWALDYSTVTATRVCLNDTKHVQTETVNTKANIIQDLSCTEDEITKYTANFENKAFEVQSKEIVTATACEHNYGEVTYEWSLDYSTVTATRVCLNDSTHIETETVTTIANIIQDLSCTEEELTKYTAIFENDAFVKQTKEVVTTTACEHDYSQSIYIWESDYSKVIATRVCKNNSNHIQIEISYTTYEVIQ